MKTSQRATFKVPGYRHLARLIERFNTRYCRGIYPTFHDAQATIPTTRPVGYNHKECSEMYLGCLDYVKPSDYAAFYWLSRLLLDAGTVFDYGGNVGWSYYAYQKYLRYPPELRWLVCDLPKVVETGQALAAKRDGPHLRFTTDFRRADGADILLTNGTLQYVEDDLPDLLGGLANKPRHVLINRVAMSDAPTYFTVQDIGPARCPYRITNRGSFVAGLQNLGYSRIDSWRCCESSCRILFHPKRSLRHYTGMYFRLDDSAKGVGVGHSTSYEVEDPGGVARPLESGVKSGPTKA